MNWQALAQSFPLLLQGLWTTILLSVLAILVSTALGLVAAVSRTSRLPVLSQIATGYVNLFRGTPLLITLLFVYFGSAGFGFNLDVIVAAVVGLSIYEGAYIGEIFRAGIEAVPASQREASRILGLSALSTFTHVVMPQTTRVVTPPLIGQYIALIKDSSLAFMIGIAELMRRGQSIIDRIGQPFIVYLVVAALYFVICYPISFVVRRLELKGQRA